MNFFSAENDKMLVFLKLKTKREKLNIQKKLMCRTPAIVLLRHSNNMNEDADKKYI